MHIEESSIQAPDFGSCLAATIMSWTFPTPTQTVEVTPLSFQREAAVSVLSNGLNSDAVSRNETVRAGRVEPLNCPQHRSQVHVIRVDSDLRETGSFPGASTACVGHRGERVARMRLSVGAQFGGTKTHSLRETANTPAVVALVAMAVLAGCAAAQEPDRRPRIASAAASPASPPGQSSALTAEPDPFDAAVPAAEYPQAALGAKLPASVVLRILIDETGRVREAKVLSDPAGLGEAAIRTAIAHFRFKPAEVHGKPVAVWWTFTVTYAPGE